MKQFPCQTKMISQDFPITLLKKWYLENRRIFPWRGSPTPYEVLVSEFMLHQTGASVVIPYFERWMKRFPTLQALSEASKEEVIKAWEGLGYYARARNLHTAAITLMQEFKGMIPDRREDLLKIKGIGPYTVGAILSFAFKKKAAAVDGNVQRVLSRYFLIEEDLGKSLTRKKIWEIAENLLPEEESWIITEGLIELGAMICTSTPKCLSCPLKQSCQAFHLKKTKDIPFKTKKITITPLIRFVAIIECEEFLLLREEKEKIMRDLFEFPYLDCSRREFLTEDIKSRFEKKLGLSLTLKTTLPPLQQFFTRYRADLFPFCFSTSQKKPVEEYMWISKGQMESLPFSSGHRKIWRKLSSFF